MAETASCSRLAAFLARLLIFLAYFICSLVVIFQSQHWSQSQCWVQSTYHQEFLINVMANPFFSSLNVLRDAPLSKMERVYYRKSNFTQNVSSVFAFPVQTHNALKKAAFLPVYPMPGPMVAADEMIWVPPDHLLSTAYYYYSSGPSPEVWSPQLDQSVNPAFRLAKGSLEAMLHVTDRAPHVGMQLPNLARCLPEPDSTKLADIQTQVDWAQHLKELVHSPQRLGSCLLTGQQASVDECRTSMILFSSVNVTFMVGIVLWITASFALFHVGGWLKSDLEFNQPDHPEVLQGSKAISGCSWLSANMDEAFMIVAIGWNAFLLFVLLDRTYREMHMIPLNNAMLAIVALLFSILVQWMWANFYVYDMDVHEAVAHNILSRMMQMGAPGGGRVAAAVPVKKQLESAGSTPQGPEEKLPVGKPVAEAAAFNTSNFLSTASLVRDYGLGYARSVMGNAPTAVGLRRRGKGGNLDEEGGSYYVHGSSGRRRTLLKQGAAMPNYTALVSMRTGNPFSQYNYANLIHKEMFNDSVQSLEYTITTPLLFATVLAAASPIVPTGLVQWAFGCLTGSHMLCIPVLYLSHIFSRKRENPPPVWLPWNNMVGAILLLLVACALLQLAGLSIFGIYMYDSFTHYSAPGSLAGITVGLIVMQVLFVVSVVVSVLANLLDNFANLQTFSSLISWLYILINLIMKLAIGLVIAVDAGNKHFPVLSCKVWDGRYQALEELHHNASNSTLMIQ